MALVDSAWRGLSSLGRIEGHVRDAINDVLARLDDTLARAGEPEGRSDAEQAGACG